MENSMPNYIRVSVYLQNNSRLMPPHVALTSYIFHIIFNITRSACVTCFQLNTDLLDMRKMSVISKAENGGSSISRISTFVIGLRKSITLYAILCIRFYVSNEWIIYPIRFVRDGLHSILTLKASRIAKLSG